MVFYGHWWALTIGLMAMWRQEDHRNRLALAMACISIPTALKSLQIGGGYQLYFLIEHVIMAVVGALIAKQWVMWWGIVATVLAILYFLRGYTFMALLFVGVLLIVFVIWRLTKSDNNQSEDK